jgi:hypothetical protein
MSGALIAALFVPVSKIWIGNLNVNGTLILSFASWHIIESIGTSIAMLMNASGIIRLQIIFIASFAIFCVAIKAVLAIHGQPEYMPTAASLTYLLLYIIPMFALRKEISHLLSSSKH